MWRWFIYRLALIIPTLGAVMVISFILSRSVSNDPIDIWLSAQGIDLQSPYGQKEYANRYKQKGLDKPVFYLSVLPHFFPANIDSYPDRSDKILIKNLLREKIHFDWIREFVEIRRLWLNLTDNTWEQKEIQDKLYYAASVSDLKKLHLLCLDMTEPNEKMSQMTDILSRLDSYSVGMYFPVILWHGTDNQFHQWVHHILSGDWGTSLKDGQDVFIKITKALQWTGALTILCLILSLSISYLSGLVMAYYSGTWTDRAIRFFWLVLYTMPVFWLASLLITYTTTDRYGSFLHLFPIPGRWYIPEGEPFMVSLGKYAYQLVLPVICLVANDISPMGQMIRNKLISQKNQPFVLLSRAKGLTSFASFKKHVLPHSFITLMTIAGGKVPALLSGSLIVEVIFNIPGLGRLTYESIISADWDIVFGIVMFLSSVVVLWLVLTDVAYKWIDPRSEKYAI